MKDSSFYKQAMKHHLYQKTYGGVVEESVNHWNADIIGVTFTKWEVNEFEIKVSLSDLRGEIKAIKRALKGSIYQNIASQSSFFSYNNVKVEENVSLTKLEKHYCYLVGDKQGGMTFNGTVEEEKLLNGAPRSRDNVKECFVPHKFYFAVPTFLIENAKELLKDVPYYGIINADTGIIKKSAKTLPRHNARQSDIMNLFFRACTEWRQDFYALKGFRDREGKGEKIHVKRKHTFKNYDGSEGSYIL